MAAAQRKSHPALRARLFSEGQRFSFFEAVHLLERTSPGVPALGEGLEPENEPVRFCVKPGFGFPPCEIVTVEEDPDGGPPRMEVAFMGLLGPSGVLPDWYNELALERMRNKDYALSAFLDIFHHRLITLFYRAWKKHRFVENYRKGGEDRLTGCLLSLCGLGTPGLLDRVGFPPETLAFHTGLLCGPSRNAAALESTINYMAGVPALLEQFMERILPLQPEDRTALGARNASLGVDAVCGGFVYECQSGFRINLGPMGFADFQRFLPGAAMLEALADFVRYQAGMEYEFEFRVFLKREDVPPCRLGAGGMLGLSTWLTSPGSPPGEDVFITVTQEALTHTRLSHEL